MKYLPIQVPGSPMNRHFRSAPTTFVQYSHSDDIICSIGSIEQINVCVCLRVSAADKTSAPWRLGVKQTR